MIYSFSYAFKMTANILKHHEGRAGRHPCTITGIPYEKGFDYWINPGFPQAYNRTVPGEKKKQWKKILYWVLILVLTIVLFILSSHNREVSRREEALRREEYAAARAAHYQKLYTFGQVHVSPLTESLEKIENWLETYNQPAARSLNPGLTREQIQQVFKVLPFTPVEELYTFYSWHNGQGLDIDVNFIPGYDFLSLEYAVKEYRMVRKISKDLEKLLGTASEKKDLWPVYFFPFISLQGDSFGVLCGGPKPGSVLELFIEDPDPLVAYPGIASFMQEIAEGFETGAYYITDEGDLETNEEKKQIVFLKYHPALTPYESNDKNSETQTQNTPEGEKIITHLYPNGLKKVKHFNVGGLLYKEETYRRQKLLEKITHYYNLEGKIEGRKYLMIDFRGNRSEVNVTWDYQPDGRVTITHEWQSNSNDNKEITKALYDSDGNWRVLTKEK